MVHLNEKFFETFLDALFKQDSQLEFSIAEIASKPSIDKVSFRNSQCDEKIRLQRQIGNVKTAIYFRDGKILLPIAFTGSYNPPLIGCIDFSGIAETNIELYFESQTLLGRVVVSSVNLSGTNGIGGSLIAKLVQGSIDKKINPVNILNLEKLSFAFPIRDKSEVRAEIKMRATGLRYEVINGGINIFIKYQFD
jgi:hypothetical protein